jgi:hypothetical protein
MKVGGVKAERRGELPPLCFAREDDQFLVFTAKPVYNWDEFDAICPEPDPKQFGVMTKEGWQVDSEAPGYLDQLRIYEKRRAAYMFIKTIEPSNIEWDKVKINDPETWKFYREELVGESGCLSENEFGHLSNLVTEANTLSYAKLEANRETFFQKRAAQASQNSQNTDQENTSSGALAYSPE